MGFANRDAGLRSQLDSPVSAPIFRKEGRAAKPQNGQKLTVFSVCKLDSLWLLLTNSDSHEIRLEQAKVQYDSRFKQGNLRDKMV